MKKHSFVNANGERNLDDFIELKPKAPIEELTARMKAGAHPKHQSEDSTLSSEQASKSGKKSKKKKDGKRSKRPEGKHKQGKNDKQRRKICRSLRYDDGSVIVLPTTEASYREFLNSTKAAEWIRQSGMREIRMNWKSRIRLPKSSTFSDWIEQDRERVAHAAHVIELMKPNGSVSSNIWRNFLISCMTGYLARQILPLGLDACPTSRMRAPVFWINAEQAGHTCDQLERFAKILPKTSCVVNGCTKQAAPTFFPLRFTEKHELDSAYLTLEKQESVRLPVQYRDSAVIVDARKLSKTDCNRFLARNPWAVIIFLGSSRAKVKQDGMIVIDHKLLQIDEITDTDMEILEELLRDFQFWIHETCQTDWFKTKKFRQRWDILQGLVTKSKIKRADQFWTKLRLLAADLLAEYLGEVLMCQDDFSEEAITVCAQQWREMLLPLADSSAEKGRSEMAAPPSAPQLSPQEIFRQAVTAMLTEHEHFLYVPRGGEQLCLPCKPDDPNFQYWGYLRWKMGSGNRPEAPAIFFRRTKFLEVFAQFAPCPCDPKQVLTHCEEHDEAGYFPPKGKGQRKDRIPQTHREGPVASVVLLLDRLDFLPDDAKQSLRIDMEQEFPDKE